MTIRPCTPILIGLLSFPALAAAVAGPDPWAYFGKFVLDGGDAFLGGLLEEGDAQLWTFGHPQDSSIGGLVYRQESPTRFHSLIRPGERLTFSQLEDGAYQRVTLSGPGAKNRDGQRAPFYSRIDTQIPTASGSIGATLLTPLCAPPHPLIVFVNGSGYTSRHIGDFATFVLSQGIAILSYDKRDGDDQRDGWQEQSLKEIGHDAAAALAWAVAQPGTDTERAGLFGSSQGGWTASIAAVQPPGADFLIVRAGPGVTELETHLHEKRQEFRAEGLHGLDLDNAVSLSRRLYQLAVSGASLAASDDLVRPWLDEDWYRRAFGDSPVSELWSERWWQWAGSNMLVSPLPYLARFRGPVLWFLGERDENVPLVSSYAALSLVLAGRRTGGYRLVIVRNAPHSFVIDARGPGAHYAEGYRDTLVAWLSEQGLSRIQCDSTQFGP